MELQEVKAINGVLHYNDNGKWFPVRIVGNFGGGGRKTIIQGGGGASFQVTATADDTTTSTSDTTVVGMSITPAAGTYLVWFSGSYNVDFNQSVFNSIYSNGVQVPSSEQSRGPLASAPPNFNSPFCCIAKVTVNGSQAIEGKWRVSSGGAGIMHQRNLTLSPTT